jgi:hypothetical protein
MVRKVSINFGAMFRAKYGFGQKRQARCRRNGQRFHSFLLALAEGKLPLVAIILQNREMCQGLVPRLPLTGGKDIMATLVLFHTLSTCV